MNFFKIFIQAPTKIDIRNDKIQAHHRACGVSVINSTVFA